MSVQLPTVPALAPGQRVEDWGKIYTLACACLDTEKKKIDLLPLYICRDDSERDVAYLATQKDTSLVAALTRCSELIDGKPSLVESTRRFFNFNAEDKSKDLKSVFFSLRTLGDAALVTKDLVMLRFLGLVPSGERFYEDNKDDFVPEMTDDKMIELFGKLKPKLDQAATKRDIIVKQERSREGYVFTASDEEAGWTEVVENLKGELNSIKDYLNDKDDKEEMPASAGGTAKESEAEAYYANQAKKDRRRCYICNKTSHLAAQCFRRKCDSCGKTGHSAQECWSGKSKPGNNTKKGNGKPNL